MYVFPEKLKKIFGGEMQEIFRKIAFSLFIIGVLAGIAGSEEMKRDGMKIEYDKQSDKMIFNGTIKRNSDGNEIRTLEKALTEIIQDIPSVLYHLKYSLSSIDNDVVIIKIDYIDAKIVNVGFHLKERKQDGIYKYAFLTNENEKLFIDFFFKDYNLVNVHLDTGFRPQGIDGNKENIFTLRSNEGKDILFTFTWNKDGSIKNVNVKPKENPFEGI